LRMGRGQCDNHGLRRCESNPGATDTLTDREAAVNTAR
jgi:hypothetical protein